MKNRLQILSAQCSHLKLVFEEKALWESGAGRPAIDPLAVTELVVTQGNGTVSVSLRFFNLHMTGLGSMKICAVWFDTQTYDLETELHMEDPTSLQDAYNVNGQVLVLPIMGTDNCNITLGMRF
ncbi:protein takeout-like [Schistocerca serialis cubense]|uniref:protein takeout-like n=1 Tax=Schistocerca serialis cubense TaxID=2023355 RepID=UPI00214F44EA|nr:protein takeout-like [Schistocerca serialis cubense]